MVTLSAVLQCLYPGIVIGIRSIDPRVDCELANDGSGDRLVSWHRPEPQPTPAEIEAARKPAALALVTERIRAERLRRQTELGFPVTLPGVGAVRFHSDSHSRSQHAGLYATAQLMLMQGATQTTPIGNPQVQWRTMGGVMVPLTVGVLLALLQASLAHEAAVHAAADAHIAAAALLDDPLAYDYSTGWPE
jgi:hypothetical protein